MLRIIKYKNIKTILLWSIITFFSTGIIIGITLERFKLDKNIVINNISADIKNLQIHRLKINNTKVIFVAVDSSPVVQIRIVFNAGSIKSNKLSGIANLLNAMIIHSGTNNKSEYVVAEQFENDGVKTWRFIDYNKAGFGFTALSSCPALNYHVQTFASIIKEPDFSTTALNKIRNKIILKIQDQEKTPIITAEKKFITSLSSRSNYDILGSIEELNKIELKDIKSFYQDYYNIDNSAIVIVGNISIDKAKELAKIITSTIPNKNITTNVNTDNRTTRFSNLVLEKRFYWPSNLAHIVLGQPIKLTDNEITIFKLSNDILEYRNNIGWSNHQSHVINGEAYFLRSQFHISDNQGFFLISWQTNANLYKSSIYRVKNILDDFIKHGPQDAELALAKKRLINSFLIQFNNSFGIANYLANNAFTDKIQDYIKDYIKKTEQISKEDIIKSLKRNLDINNMSMITISSDT